MFILGSVTLLSGKSLRLSDRGLMGPVAAVTLFIIQVAASVQHCVFVLFPPNLVLLPSQVQFLSDMWVLSLFGFSWM